MIVTAYAIPTELAIFCQLAIWCFFLKILISFPIDQHIRINNDVTTKKSKANIETVPYYHQGILSIESFSKLKKA